MSTITKDLGVVTAYGYAVSKGYTGTEEEFAELMASYATVAAQAAQSAETAEEAAEAAAQAVLDANAAKTSAQQSAASAGNSASAASGSASSASQSASAAQTSAEYAAGSAQSASQSAEAANTAKTDAQTAKTDAETAQGKAEEAQAKAEESAESINPDTLAKINGYYQDMTVGEAEQLLATVGNEDSVPYNFRTSGGGIDIGDREEDMVVGGTVVWNQLVILPSNRNGNGLAFTKSADGTHATINGTNAGNTWYIPLEGTGKSITGHVYFADKGALIGGYQLYNDNGGVSTTTAATKRATVGKATSSKNFYFWFGGGSAFTYDNVDIYPVIIDLTKMFGSTIADYIYNLEQANEGAGVAWFKKLFPKDYYEYNEGELMSVKTSAHKMVGFNAFDVESGTAKLVGGVQYQITGTYTSMSLDGETITPDSSGYFTPSASGTMTVTGGGSNTCIHLVWDGERDGEYEPYEEHVYPLDSSLELRGIPKLDSANNLYYDGDTYESDGTITRRFGVVDLGTLTYSKSSIVENGFVAVGEIPSDFPLASSSTAVPNWFCPKYAITSNSGLEAASTDKAIAWRVSGTNKGIIIKDSSYSSIYEPFDAEAFKSAMSGVMLVYELAEPTTETAEPYQNPQIVSNFGTEEYTDDRAVPVPVGHETVYLPNLRAKLESAPDSPDADGEYIMKQTSGANEYIALGSSATIQGILEKLPNPPSSDGTYTLKVTVTNGTASYSWEA